MAGVSPLVLPGAVCLLDSPVVIFLYMLTLTSPLVPMLGTAFCFQCGVLITKWLNPNGLTQQDYMHCLLSFPVTFLEKNGEATVLGIRLLACLHDQVMAG